MPQSISHSPANRLTTALLLTSVGGFVDAIGWIALLEVFTANMSGNSIHVGMATGNLDLHGRRRFGFANQHFGGVHGRPVLDLRSG
jgi:uncharacterized membrane protein YoaK (UPF0700 family)